MKKIKILSLSILVVMTTVLFASASEVVNDIFIIFKRAITKNQKLSIIEKICGINNSKNRGYIIAIFILLIVFITYGILRNFI